MWNWQLRRTIVALVAALLLLSTAPLTAACLDRAHSDARHHVVLLEYQHRADNGALLETTRSTGTLVSETGLVLTSYSLLLDADMGPQKLLSHSSGSPSPRALSVDVWATEKTDNAPNARGIVIGHDWRRDLLLVKIPHSSVLELGLIAPQLARDPVQIRDRICLAGFLEQGAGYAAIPSEDTHSVTARDQVKWKINGYAPSRPEAGSAVLDHRDGTLLGLLVADYDDAVFLPIEFADRLLSQVFISDILEEMASFERFQDELRGGVIWNFRIMRWPSSHSDPEILIRFFSKPMYPSRTVCAVEVSSRVQGIDKDGNENYVGLEGFESKAFLPIPRTEHYAEHLLSDYVDLAGNLGFQKLNYVEFTLLPYLNDPACLPGRRDKMEVGDQTVFQFPLDMEIGG
jgi:hypothetical protein